MKLAYVKITDMQPANPQPRTPSNQTVSGTGLNTDIVGNIPLKTQDGFLNPLKDDEELDSLMNDVSNNLKQTGTKPVKKRFFDFKRQAKTQKQPQKPKQAAPAHSQPQTPGQPKIMTPKSNPKPVLAICLTVIVTGTLIAAAVFAYK